MITEERLEKLEHDLRELRAELAAGLTTHEVVIVDASGKIRTSLSVDNEGLALILFDKNGNIRAGLTVLRSGPGLRLVDRNNKAIWSAP